LENFPKILEQFLPSDYKGFRVPHLKQLMWQWLELKRFQQCDRWIKEFFREHSYGSKDRRFYRDCFFLFLRFGHGATKILFQISHFETETLLKPAQSSKELKKLLEKALIFLDTNPQWESTWLSLMFLMKLESERMFQKKPPLFLEPKLWWLNLTNCWWQSLKIRNCFLQFEQLINFFMKSPTWCWSNHPLPLKTNTQLRHHHSYQVSSKEIVDLEEKSFWIQDINSQKCCDQIEIKDHDWIWDVCAGAGGKTINLMKRKNFKGVIWATDIRKRVLNEISKRLSKVPSKTDLHKLPWNGETLPKEMKESLKSHNKSGFDVILIDAPCSGVGRIRRSPGLAFWDLNRLIKTHLQSQKNLLTKTAKWLNTDGTLIYITCSWTQEENENQIQEFLKEANNFTLIESKFFSHPETNGDSLMFFKLKKNFETLKEKKI
jgi:hypothetical protein